MSGETPATRLGQGSRAGSGWQGLSGQGPHSACSCPACRQPALLLVFGERPQCHLFLSQSASPVWTPHVRPASLLGAFITLGVSPLASLLPVSREGGSLSFSSLLCFRGQVERSPRSRLAANLCRLNDSMNEDLTKGEPLYFPHLRASRGPDASLWS